METENLTRAPGDTVTTPRWVYAGLMILAVSFYVYTVSRGLTAPNAYTIAHWLQSYDFGFVKRGLPGELLQPLLQYKSPGEIRLIIHWISAGIFYAFSASLLWSVWLIIERSLNEPLRTYPAAATLVFLTSPFLVVSAFLTGYFDQLLGILVILSIFLLSRGALFPVAALSVLGLAIHEMYLLLGLPAVAFAFLVKEVAGGAGVEEGLRRKTALRACYCFGPALLAFVGIALSGLLLSEPVVKDLRAQVESYGLLTPAVVEDALHHLEYDFFANFEEMRRRPLDLPQHLRELRIVLPAALFLCASAALSLALCRASRLIPVLILAVLSPLAAHALAWDSFRFTSFTIFHAYAAVLATALMITPQRTRKWEPRLLLLCSPLVVLSGLWASVPLMDGVVDGGGVFSLRAGPTRRGYVCTTLLFENSNFESGTLSGWRASGEAFGTQPTRRDATRDRAGRPLANEGEWWVGTYAAPHLSGETRNQARGYRAKGRLESPEFEISGDELIFLISGGSDPERLHVSLLVEGEEVHRATGIRHPVMRPVLWEVARYRGRSARIEIVDESDANWGHLNADGFCYY